MRLKVNQDPRYLNGFEFGIGVITWSSKVIVLLAVDLEFVAKMDFNGLTVILVNL